MKSNTTLDSSPDFSAILQRRERAAILIDATASDAFIACDKEGRIQHWNNAATRLLGWTLDEALEMNVADIVPEEMRDAHRHGMARLMANPTAKPMATAEVPALRKDGTTVPTELTLAVRREGEEVMVVSIIRDITERRKAEEERAAERALADTIMENIPAAIYAKDPATGRHLFVNKAYEELSGRTREDIVGKTDEEAFGPEERPASNDRESAATRDNVTIFDRIMTRADGEKRTLSVTRLKTSGPTGKPILLCFAHDVTDERKADQRVAYLAHHDPMTGLLNRTRFNEVLEEHHKNGNIAVITIDLDRFKIVNDLYGHTAGDEVLVETAKRMKAITSHPMARLGGDEFAILIPDIKSAPLIARRCVEALGRPYGILDRGVGIGGSVGVATSCDGSDVDIMMRNADLAMYRAKREGRNRVCFFEASMDDAARERRHVEAQLRQAIANGDIHMEYQPLATTEDGAIVSFEALARWHHEELGNISPSLFIPIAEESGLMGALGSYILAKAATEASGWDTGLKVAVNLSPAQLEDDNIVNEIAGVLESTGLEASRLEIEITEGMLIRDVERGIRILGEIRDLGVSVSMDDFGTGYSSLSYFRNFPFDKVKIDQSFIRDMEHNPQSLAIVQAVIRLGRGLGMPVVAEGVETSGQLEILRREGCNIVQGYHIGRPLEIGSYKNNSILNQGEEMRIARAG